MLKVFISTSNTQSRGLSRYLFLRSRATCYLEIHHIQLRGGQPDVCLPVITGPVTSCSVGHAPLYLAVPAPNFTYGETSNVELLQNII